MKKLRLLVMPLMVVSLLMSCGDNSKKSTTYTVTFDAGTDGKFIGGEQKLSFKSDKGTKLLTYIKQLLPPTSENQTFAYYEYEEKNKTINYGDTVTSDITLKANYFDSSVEPTGNLTSFDWRIIKNIAVTGNPSRWFNIGATKTVEVNGKNHKVRIIGFDHDRLKASDSINPLYAGITFEFSDVITEPLSSFDQKTKWDEDNHNFKYSESTLSNFLNKTTADKQCIFDRLPDELKADNMIEEVYKPVAETSEYEINTSYTAKLFPLSHKEITTVVDDAKAEGNTYAFYVGSGDTNNNRVKKTVEGSAVDYWLRSPAIRCTPDNVWHIMADGGPNKNGMSFGDLYGVAPAFCI